MGADAPTSRAQGPSDEALVRAYSEREIGKILTGGTTELLSTPSADYHPVIHLVRGYQIDRILPLSLREYSVQVHFSVDKWLSQDAETHKIMVHEEPFVAKYYFLVEIAPGGAAALKGDGIPTPNVKAGQEKPYLISPKP